MLSQKGSMLSQAIPLTFNTLQLILPKHCALHCPQCYMRTQGSIWWVYQFTDRLAFAPEPQLPISQPLTQWFSAFLRLGNFNAVPHAVVPLNHNIMSLLLCNCKFVNRNDRNVNIWYATPVKRLVDPQRGSDPLVENHFFDWVCELGHPGAHHDGRGSISPPRLCATSFRFSLQIWRDVKAQSSHVTQPEGRDSQAIYNPCPFKTVPFGAYHKALTWSYDPSDPVAQPPF